MKSEWKNTSMVLILYADNRHQTSDIALKLFTLCHCHLPNALANILVMQSSNVLDIEIFHHNA